MIIFGVFISGGLLAVVIAASITKPITGLINSTKIIGSGDLEYRVNIKTKDEIGELASSFNRMVEKLKKANDEIKKSNIN